MKLNFQRQAGATLIEIIMVVALISIITVGGLVYYNSAQDATKVQEAVSGLSALNGVIRNQFSTQGDYAGISGDVVMKFGNIPETLLVRSGSTPTHLKHPWNNGNGAITIAPAETAAANDSYSIVLTKVPAKICADLASKTYRHFISVRVNSTAVSSVPSIVNACGTSGDVTITYVQR